MMTHPEYSKEFSYQSRDGASFDMLKTLSEETSFENGCLLWSLKIKNKTKQQP